MNLSEQLIGLVRGALHNPRSTPSGWIKANCPMCVHRGHRPDTRQRFGIRPQGEEFGLNCFNCKFTAHWTPGRELSRDLKEFLTVTGTPQRTVEELAFQAYLQKHNLPAVSGRKLLANPQTHWKTTELPPHAHPIHDWLVSGREDPELVQAAEFAVERGINDLTKVYWTPDLRRRINQRLIIPFRFEGRIVGYTGRRVTPGPKALKHVHEMPPHFLFNLDEQNDYDREYTIVTETAIDALALGGVASLGGTLSDEQCQMLNQLHTIKIVCPDRDESGDGLVQAALRHGWRVSFPPWEHHIKDAGDAIREYGLLYTAHSIVQHQQRDPDKIRIWRKLDKEKHGNKRVHT